MQPALGAHGATPSQPSRLRHLASQRSSLVTPHGPSPWKSWSMLAVHSPCRCSVCRSGRPGAHSRCATGHCASVDGLSARRGGDGHRDPPTASMTTRPRPSPASCSRSLRLAPGSVVPGHRPALEPGRRHQPMARRPGACQDCGSWHMSAPVLCPRPGTDVHIIHMRTGDLMGRE